MGSGLPREVSQRPRGVLSHEELRQDPCRMLPGCWERNLGSVCQAAGGLRTFPPAAQDGDSGGDSSAVEPSGWGSGGLTQGRTVAPSCALRPPLTPRATGCSSGPGAGTCGTAAPGAGGERPGPLSRPSLPEGGPRVLPTPAPSLRPTLLAASPLPRPRLTGPRGRSCLPRNPAPPAGTRVSPGHGAPSADPPRGAGAEHPATHLRQWQEWRQ